MEAQGGLFDVGSRPPVVVDDHDPGPGGQQLRHLGLFRPVGVHHHDDAGGLGQANGLIRRDEDALVLRQGGQLLRLFLGRIGRGGANGLDGHVFFSGNGAHAGYGPQYVQVGVFVPHHNDLVGAGQQLGQGGGHHAALDLGPALGLFRAAAEEGKVVAVFDHHLVAAPAEGHVQRQGGVFVELPGGLPVAAEADGEGGGDPVGALHLADLIQQGELLPAEDLELRGLHQQQIVVPVIAA